MPLRPPRSDFFAPITITLDGTITGSEITVGGRPFRVVSAVIRADVMDQTTIELTCEAGPGDAIRVSGTLLPDKIEVVR